MSKRNVVLVVAVLQFLVVFFLIIPRLWDEKTYLAEITTAILAALSASGLSFTLFFRWVLNPFIESDQPENE